MIKARRKDIKNSRPRFNNVLEFFREEGCSVDGREEDGLHLVVAQLKGRLVCHDEDLPCAQDHLGVLVVVERRQLLQHLFEVIWEVVGLLALQGVLTSTGRGGKERQSINIMEAYHSLKRTYFTEYKHLWRLITV